MVEAMAEERKVGFVVSAENQTKQTFEEIKRDAQGMAQAVSKAGQDANKGLSGVGDGAAPTAQKVDRSTRSMIQSIQRLTARMEAGSSSNSKYWETLAQQRNVDVNALRPYLNQLDAVVERQGAATAALVSGGIEFNRYGMSAKQTAAAMRGVPAQITDIVVALQGGQRPMTVMLQQGGQLKDMFGGIVPAAQALGSTVLKMVNPMMLAAGAIVGLYAAYRSGASEGERFRQTLLLTGNAAGTSVDQLMTMAARIDGVVGTQRRAAAALNELAQTTTLGARSFERYAEAALRWEDATGTAAAEVIQQFEEIGQSPVEAITKLDQSMNFLTDSTRSQIKELEEQGRHIDAAKLAQHAYADAINERAPQILQQLGLLERGWRAVKQAGAEAVDDILGFGRPQTLDDRVRIAEQELREAENLYRITGFDPKGIVESRRQKLMDLQAELALQGSLNSLMQDGIELQGVRLEAEKNLGAYVRERHTAEQQRAEDLKQESQAHQARLADQKRMLDMGLINEATYRERVQQIEGAHQEALRNIREKYKESSSGSISATQAELARLNGLIEAERQREAALHSLADAQANLNEGEKLAIQYGEKLKLVTDAKTRAQLQANKAKADEYGALKRANDEFDRQVKASESTVTALRRQTATLDDQIATYGMGKSAIEEMTIARVEEQLAIAEGMGVSERTIEMLRTELEQRRKLATAMRTKEALDAQLREWQAWEREVDRIFQQVEQSLTDAIFDGGKNGRDLVKDLFKTLTLRVIINPVMGALQGTITQSLGGLFGYQNPQQGGPGMMGMIQNANTLYQAYSGGMASNLGQGIGWIGEQIGSSALRSFATGLTGAAGAAGTVAGITSVGAGLGASLGASIGTSTAAMASTSFSASLGGGAGAAMGATAGASGLAGAGAALGAALPWVGGALAIGSLIGGGLFGREPTTRRSQRAASGMTSDGSFVITGRDGRQSSAAQEAARSIAEQSVRAANELFAQMGVDAAITSFLTTMESSIKGDRDGVGSSGSLRIGDEIVDIGLEIKPSWTKGGFGGWSSEEMLPRLATDIQLTILEAFQKADVLPSLLGGIDVRGLDAAAAQELVTTVQRFVQEVNTFQEALETLPFENLRDLSFEAAAHMLELAGGIDSLTSAQQAYYAAFYTQGEQIEHLRGSLTDALDDLGFMLPATIAEYRALVDSLDMTTVAGREAYVMLMQLAPQFAQMTEAAKAMAEEVANSLMRGVGRNAEIDFDWLEDALADVDTDGFVATMNQVFERLSERVGRLIDGIAGERDAVQVAREAILNTAPMTPEQIIGQIRGINTALPPDLDVAAANRRLSAANSSVESARAAWERARAAQASHTAPLQQLYGKAPDTWVSGQTDNDLWEKVLGDWNELHRAEFGKYMDRPWDSDRHAVAQKEKLDAQYAALREAANAEIAAKNATAAAANASYAAMVEQAQERLNQATAAQAAAAQQARESTVAYADSIQRFIMESSESAGKLGRLREETMRYYEAQQALANLMANSADALRQRAYDYRFGQLDPEDQFKQLQSEFTKAYSLALSTDGETLAGYADTLNRLVNPMLSAAQDMFASDAQYSSFVAQALARVETIAGRLETLAPQDYEDQSLEVLRKIDETLGQLDASAKSADQILVGAVTAGSEAIVNGLRQVANALTGKSVAAFASGGFHTGGLRIVGERGPELELTGPSRIFSAEQTRQILSGGDSNAELLAEVRALRHEVARLQAAAEATASNTGRTSRQLDRMEMDGMLIRTEPDLPVHVEVVS